MSSLFSKIRHLSTFISQPGHLLSLFILSAFSSLFCSSAAALAMSCTGVRSQELGVRSKESGVRSQESGFQVFCQKVSCPVFSKGIVKRAQRVPLPGRYQHHKVRTTTKTPCTTALGSLKMVQTHGCPKELCRP